MYKKKSYIKPVAENVVLQEPLMDLVIKVSGATVDDEAAKQQNGGFGFDDEEITGETPVKQNNSTWDD